MELYNDLLLWLLAFVAFSVVAFIWAILMCDCGFYTMEYKGCLKRQVCVLRKKSLSSNDSMSSSYDEFVDMIKAQRHILPPSWFRLKIINKFGPNKKREFLHSCNMVFERVLVDFELHKKKYLSCFGDNVKFKELVDSAFSFKSKSAFCDLVACEDNITYSRLVINIREYMSVRGTKRSGKVGAVIIKVLNAANLIPSNLPVETYLMYLRSEFGDVFGNKKGCYGYLNPNNLDRKLHNDFMEESAKEILKGVCKVPKFE